MSSGATPGTAQKSRTLKLGIQQAAPTFPQQHISATERPLKDYIVRAVYGRTDEKLDQNDSVLAPRLGQITLAKKYKALHDLYVATESKKSRSLQYDA